MANAISSAPKLYTQSICPQEGEERHVLNTETVEEICQLFRESPQLGGVKLDRCQIDAENAKALFGCIGSLQQVNSISLIRFPVDDEAFEAFAEMLASSPHIEEVEIAGGHLSEQQMNLLCEALKTHRQLKSLTLMANSVSQANLDPLCEGIAANEQLRILKLDACGLASEASAKVIHATQSLSHLRSLDLSKNELHGIGIRALAMRVQELPQIKFLLLNQVGIKGREDGEHVADILKANTIMALSLEDNFLQESITPKKDALGPISEALQGNPSLAKLSLNHCGLTPVGFSVLGSTIASPDGEGSKLVHLDLGSNKLSSQSIPDLGGKKIRPLLANIPSLEELALEGCELGPESALHIAAGLTEYQGKQLTLKLSQNPIKSTGYKHLREALGIMPGAAEVQLLETKQKYKFLLKLPDGSIRNDQEAKAMGLFQECVKFSLLTESLAQGAWGMLQQMNKGELSEENLEKLVKALEEVMEPITLMRSCRDKGLLNPIQALLVQTCVGNKLLKDHEKEKLSDTLKKLEMGKLEASDLSDTLNLLHTRLEPIQLAKECQDKGLLSEEEIEGVAALLSKLQEGKLTKATMGKLVASLKEKLSESPMES